LKGGAKNKVEKFYSKREIKKFVRELPKGTAYKILNVMNKEFYVFYVEWKGVNEINELLPV
jgi:hypothetical protein